MKIKENPPKKMEDPWEMEEYIEDRRISNDGVGHREEKEGPSLRNKL